LSLYLHAFANRADLSQGLELHGQSWVKNQKPIKYG
jgi:hypothetical protein